LGKKFSKNNDVYAIGRSDMSVTARNIGCEFFPWFDMASFAKTNCDVIILSCSIISFEEVLQSIPKDIFKGKLVVDVLSVKTHARNMMLQYLPEDSDILCTHPVDSSYI
jgi:prephenate dehydrogenase